MTFWVRQGLGRGETLPCSHIYAFEILLNFEFCLAYLMAIDQMNLGPDLILEKPYIIDDNSSHKKTWTMVRIMMKTTKVIVVKNSRSL